MVNEIDQPRTHEQNQEWVQLQNDLEQSKLATERAHAIAVIEATKDIELEKIRATNTRNQSQLDHEQRTNRWWTLTNVSVSSVLTLSWMGAAIFILVSAVFIPKLASIISVLFSILALMYGLVQVAAAQAIGKAVGEVKDALKGEE